MFHGLGKIPREVDTILHGALSQAGIDRIWKLVGLQPPAPPLPASLEGATLITTRDGKLIKRPGSKKWFHRTAEENDFINFLFGQLQRFDSGSGASKVAGGILQVASVVFPVLGYAQAAATAANYALAKGSQGGLQAQATRVMTPALDKAAAIEAARQDELFAAQLQKINAASPTVPLKSSPKMAPTSIPATIPVNVAAAKPKWSTTQKALLGAGAAALLLEIIL